LETPAIVIARSDSDEATSKFRNFVVLSASEGPFSFIEPEKIEILQFVANTPLLQYDNVRGFVRVMQSSLC
jgi:hypothetical protein